jgi:hypothetical protein
MSAKDCESAAIEAMFAGEVVKVVQTADERYRYKKQAGSSDTKTTSDELE